MSPYRPRIYKRRGLWYCAGYGCAGEGYDPAHAYADWWAEVHKPRAQFPPLFTGAELAEIFHGAERLERERRQLLENRHAQ